MTKEEIIELAKQAGFVDYELDDGTTNAFDERYEAFAKLVAAKEREECAKEVENALYGQEGCGKAAKAIRARGNHD